MTTTIYTLFLSALLTADNGPRIDARIVRVGPTAEAERLLRIAEDKGRSSAKRVRAIDQVGRRREAAVVPRLLRFLPGEGDVITYRVVIALGQIGDRSALPALRKLRDDPNIELPGKIRSALQGAIDALTKSQGKQGGAAVRPRE
jgi:HEAT repeat protein